MVKTKILKRNSNLAIYTNPKTIRKKSYKNSTEFIKRACPVTARAVQVCPIRAKLEAAQKSPAPDAIERPTIPAVHGSASSWAPDFIRPNRPIGIQQRLTAGRKRPIDSATKMVCVSHGLSIGLGLPIGLGLATFLRSLAPNAKSSALLLLKGPEKCP